MTKLELYVRLRECRQQIKLLRDDNARVRESREQWKAKHRARQLRLQNLRRELKRARQARDHWRAQAPNAGRRRKASPGVHLSVDDLERILSIPPR